MIEKKLNILAVVKPKEYDDNVNLNSDSKNQDDDKNLFDLKRFALNGQSAEMRKRMLEDKFILGRIAILGQCTVIYAPPGTGKTLLVLALLCKSIERGDIRAEDVFYINADDNQRGLTDKTELAEKNGFTILAPSHHGFNANMLPAILKDQCSNDKARGGVIILDTLKKFANLMDKTKGTQFMRCIREFVSHGGSAILLAHTNKHRNDEGGLIYAGTADVVDDTDCAYTLDEVTLDKSKGIRSVKFSNIKARGDNAIEEIYEYSIAEGVSYFDKLRSVRLLGEEEKNATIQRKKIDEKLRKNADAIRAIKDLIRRGVTKKTELINAAAAETGISKNKIMKVLNGHEGRNYAEGELWQVKIGPDNSHLYRLNVKFEGGV
ncbi:AAA family ATPase [Nitrosomonas sp.]|uniref:AAA family ATPase n=1 Tax=Nitrosomonas sp. TaxID=42353 RepID=UPI002614E9FB|nr:AAA family ATPase [Nitrosomonas sp.]MCW5601816.1 ATP-binding protein [Nitrosomonas sp.]